MRFATATALLALATFVAAAPARAAEHPPTLDPALSLIGDCTTAAIDPVPDPSCPYAPAPDGPSGKFDEPRVISIDPTGNEYVFSWADAAPSGHIDVFDDR